MTTLTLNLKATAIAIVATLAAVLTSCDNSQNEEPEIITQRDTVSVAVDVAICPAALDFYDLTFCFTDAAGQPAEMAITADKLQTLDPSSELFIKMSDLIEAFEPSDDSDNVDKEALISSLRMFRIRTDNVVSLRQSGHYKAVRKADAPTDPASLFFPVGAAQQYLNEAHISSHSFASHTSLQTFNYNEEDADIIASLISEMPVYEFSFTTGSSVINQ